MDKFHLIVAFVSEALILIGVIAPMIANIKKISDGTKCQLRNTMLHIYYHNKDKDKIRQYEYENFVMLYNAYKALGGNSFIDKIYSEVKTWEVVS